MRIDINADKIPSLKNKFKDCTFVFFLSFSESSEGVEAKVVNLEIRIDGMVRPAHFGNFKRFIGDESYYQLEILILDEVKNRLQEAA